VDGKLISPERTEAERNLASHCEKQSANHKPAYDQVCGTAAAGRLPLGWAALLLGSSGEPWCRLFELSQPGSAACVSKKMLCVCYWSASPPPGFKIRQQKEEKYPV